jgi:LPXTG-site transpeptidase (sortase) family protein
MYPKGDIYKSSDFTEHGVVNLSVSFKRKLFYHTIRVIGASMITVSIVGIIFSYGPIIKDEVKYGLNSISPSVRQEQLNLIAEAQRISSVQKETEQLGINSSFSLVVPKIDAISNIVANVNAGDEEEYSSALKNGIAHARGTYFPGQGKNIFLFSHSTDSPLNVSEYNAVFFLLRKLESGDKIAVYFADKKYIYEVDYKVITGAGDTHWLYDDLDSERLVLQTCDPPGTSLNRLLIIAKPIK